MAIKATMDTYRKTAMGFSSLAACCWLSSIGILGLTAAAAPVTVHVVDGMVDGRFVGRYTSQLQENVIDSMFPAVNSSSWAGVSMVDSSVLRYLDLGGDYMADAPLSLPSLLVLRLSGSITDSKNLSESPLNGAPSAYPALVMLNGTTFSAVVSKNNRSRAVINASVHTSTKMHAVSVLDGQKNSVRGIRALAQWQTAIGVRGGSQNEVSSCEVGGVAGQPIASRAIWTIATSRAYIHHNHVHHSNMHALDFDAYTSNSVAWGNLCEDNRDEGIFVEETATDNVIAANVCRRNQNGIGVYSNVVGPVKNNVFFGNVVEDNTKYGITAGGLGHDATKYSQGNVFFGNSAAGNQGDAAFNAMHGAVQENYWFGNGHGTVSFQGHSQASANVSIFRP